jgi:FAD/FMN-containing dehydrogenase/Fe-S oxidoreductase
VPSMVLPVLDTHGQGETGGAGVSAAERERLAHDLTAMVRGQVRFGAHDRMLYATDASIYQVEPIGVVVPADVADAAAVVEYCGARSVAMLPRGGGTSLAGQCTNLAVVLDIGANCRRVVEVNAAEGWVEVEPGITVDALNAELAARGTGLFFAPDPATTAQAAIGGCVGNNAAGSRSVKYGRTSENLLAIDAVLADGSRVRFGRGAGGRDPLARVLADRVIEIVRRHEGLIRERYPKTLRQNAGYGLDRILKQLDAGATAETLDLAQLLCGSEGTLAVTLHARLRLHPVPKAKGLGLLAFPDVDAAIAAVVPILGTGPSAVELVDDVVIEAARGNLECSRFVDAFPRVDNRDPAAVLYVEYQEANEAALRERFAALRAVVGESCPRREVTDATGMADAWKLRKAGEPLLHGLPGHRKPLTFVEDNAVPPERLGEFVKAFRAIVEREGTRAAFWAHASVGVLHVRPMLDPHDPVDVEKLKRIAVEVADLAKRCGGVMSGEHGDGRVRGPLLERFFGPELMGAFREVKAAFDPKGLLNPGNIVRPGPVDSIVQRTRIQPDPAGPAHDGPSVPAVETFYAYDDQHGFDGAVERCNGAGVCRKTSGGTMCPSYRGTLDERHSTRGRGNALRLAITGQVAGSVGGEARWADPETIKTLDLCLACKACKSECPSNVDIARLKAEYTAQRYREGGRLPLKARLIGHVRMLNRVGSMTPGLANWVNGFPPVRAVIGRIMGVHPKRSLPKFTRSLYRLWKGGLVSGGAAAGSPRVALFADCFTTYNESEIGLAAVRVMSKLGYGVDVPKVGCCGRSMISVGMLPQAIEAIDATIADLAGAIDDPAVRAILVAEPSCLSAMKDDWLQLKCRTPIERRKKLAAKAMLIEEFLDKHWDAHPNQKLLESAAHRACQGTDPILLHMHCHQKALWGLGSSVNALKMLFNHRLRVPDTGCCGMAGSFGYDREKFDLSMRIAELPGGGVLPHVRAMPAGAVVLATGTSCRHQIKDGTAGACQALHPVQLIDRALKG